MTNTRRACLAVFILCGLSSLLCRLPYNNHHFIIQNIIGRLFLLLINVALEKLTMHACFQVFQTNIGRNNSIPKMKPLLFTREMREQNQRMYKKRKKEIQRNIDWS